MSQENVEIVRRTVEVYAREGLDASLRYYAPEIEWSTTDMAIERATYHGHDVCAASPAASTTSSTICASTWRI